jgi:regulator of sigma E protease
MSTLVVNGLAVIVVLGVMIIFHELGHFLAAKYFDVRVEAFSIGFGKRLAGRQYGDTDYRICALPLGGYVKMAGDNIGEGTGDPGEFLSKPRWQRFIIAVMGPIFNFILAVAMLTGLYVFHYEKEAILDKLADIGYVAENSAASRAGIQLGDRIVEFDGVRNPNWESLQFHVLSNPAHPVETSYLRDGKEFKTTLTPEPERRERVGVAGWAPQDPAMVASVDPGESASQAGIEPGDRIYSVNGQVIGYWPEMIDIVQKSKGQPLQLGIRRGGRDFTVTVTARNRETPGVGQMWRIGVTFQKNDVIVKPLPLPAAFKESLARNRIFAAMIFDFVGKLLERRMSPRSMAGPIGIATEAGDAARRGAFDFITLMAFISVNLGIFNLFPIPILDGGQILMLLIEGALRRDLSVAVKEKIITVGFVFLVLFAVYVSYMDIVKTLPPRFERLLP